ncbi:MAG: caspase family protein [Bacteroidales bacterium]
MNTKVIAFSVMAVIYSNFSKAQIDENINTLAGHQGWVYSVSFSPNGQYALSASTDNTLKLWEVNTGKCIRTFTGHTNVVGTKAFSPDGRLALSGSDDKTIKLWDINTGNCLKTFTGHTSYVNSVAFSPDGKFAISGSTDNTLKLWDIDAGTCIRTFTGHSSFINSVAYSPDGKFAISGSADKTIKLWDINTGLCIKSFTGHSSWEGIVMSVVFSPIGNSVLSGSADKTIKLWNIETGECIRTFEGHSQTVWSVAFSNDGNYILSGSEDGTIKVWDINTGQCLHTYSGHTGTVISVAFSPNSNVIISGGKDNCVKLWSTGKIFSVTERIKNYVENHIQQWQQKDEFEKLSDYQQRVNEKNREVKIEEFTQNALSILKKEKAKYIDWKSLAIKGNYDAENESYLLSSPQLADMVLKVPISEAPQFKTDFSSLEYKYPDFIVYNDQLALSKLTIVNPSNSKIYEWNGLESSTYSVANIQYNFAPISTIPVNQGNQVLKPKIDEKNINIGRSDVDVNIPVNQQVNDKTFAVIIANENYMREISVQYAINDGTIFREYCEKTLGIPSKNIHFLQDATYGNMRSEIKWISDVAAAFGGEAKILFYYAGHGMPNESDRSAYLLPVDGFSSDFETAIRLDELYGRLSGCPAQSVTVFLDACFSGSVRDDGMLASARGVKIKPRANIARGNMVVFSAATGEETAYPYREKQHGLFTYFLLKKLRDTNGNVDYSTLSNYIIENVKQQAILVNQKSQTPQVNVSPDLQSTWQQLKIK